MKFREKARVLTCSRIAEDIFSLALETEKIAAAAMPGQFVSVYSKDSSRLLPRPISVCEADESYRIFCGALRTVCRALAVKMAADGEGATHLIEMRVYNADTKENARILARSVVGSSLVKAMIFGKDANCGRILCALGYAGPDFDPAAIELYLHGREETLCFYRDGCVQDFDEEKAAAILAETAVRFSCDMKMGTAEATAWGCDLTYDYVKINGDYRS